MRIAIVGAGAVGGWLGVSLAASGQEVCVLARGQTRDAIARAGLRLSTGEDESVANVTVSDNADDLGPQDIVVIAVKAYALRSVVSPVLRMLQPHTLLVPAMNGVPWWFMLDGAPLQAVDPDGAIARAFPLSQIAGCVVHASCRKAAPGHAVLTGGNRLILGDPRGVASQSLTALRDVLQQAGIDTAIGSAIRQDIWYKLWGNMTTNPISALTGALGDRILADALVRRYMLSIMAEASEIGRRIGCPIAQGGEDRLRITAQLGALKTSMLQDAEAGKPLEIDALLGAPREIANRVGVATPFMDSLHGLVRLYAAVHAPTAA